MGQKKKKDDDSKSYRVSSSSFPFFLFFSFITIAFSLPPQTLFPSPGQLGIGHRLESEIGSSTGVTFAAVPVTQETTQSQNSIKTKPKNESTNFQMKKAKFLFLTWHFGCDGTRNLQFLVRDSVRAEWCWPPDWEHLHPRPRAWCCWLRRGQPTWPPPPRRPTVEEQFRASCDCRQSAKPAARSAQQLDAIASKSRPRVGWVWTSAAGDDDADAIAAEAVSVDDEGDDSRATRIWLANQPATDRRNQRAHPAPRQSRSASNPKWEGIRCRDRHSSRPATRKWASTARTKT